MNLIASLCVPTLKKQERKFVPIGDIVSDDITDYTVRIAYC